MDKKLTQEEKDELRKSLTTLGLSEEEISEYIEKGGEKEEEAVEEETIAEQAKGGGEKEEEKEEVEKTTDEDIEKRCGELKVQKEAIEKAIDELESKMGKKKGEDLNKSIENDIEKAFGERIDDIEKAFDSRLDSIEKAFQDSFETLAAEVKKIGDTPLGTKSILTNVNFLEKGINIDINERGDSKVLSITKDKDELLKGMQDELGKEKDPDIRAMLEEGISDYTINPIPHNHGAKALAHLSRKQNITLEQ